MILLFHMHTTARIVALSCVASLIAGGVYADRPVRQDSPQTETKEELVFVTGSLIPKRIKVSRVGTPTYSPLRVIDRREIDQTGRSTTAAAVANEPSVREFGH